jgi:hypothetical protein
MPGHGWPVHEACAEVVSVIIQRNRRRLNKSMQAGSTEASLDRKATRTVLAYGVEPLPCTNKESNDQNQGQCAGKVSNLMH